MAIFVRVIARRGNARWGRPKGEISYTARGVARNLLRGTNQEVWGTEVPSRVQGQNTETLENTNGAVTKIDLR